MKHASCHEKLLDLAYGELPPRHARRVRAHVARCPECREELARIEATRSAMRGLEPQQAPERGEASLLAAARQAVASGEFGRARQPRPWLPTWALAGAATAAVVLAVGAVSFRLLSPAGPGEVREEAAPKADKGDAIARSPGDGPPRSRAAPAPSVAPAPAKPSVVEPRESRSFPLAPGGGEGGERGRSHRAQASTSPAPPSASPAAPPRSPRRRSAWPASRSGQIGPSRASPVSRRKA